MIVSWAAGDAPDMVSDGKTGDAGPAVAYLEQAQRIDECEDLLLRWSWFKKNRKNAERAEKIALPEFVARARGQGGVQDALNFRAGGEPFGDAERGGFDCRQADG